LGPKVIQEKENAKTHVSGKKIEDKQSPALDVSTFISKLAKKHGVAKGEYTRKRSFSEWESLFMQVAGRISHTSMETVDKIIDI
jgi:hypothetical protein